MNQYKIVLSLTIEQGRQIQELAKKECLPVATLAKAIILKYLTQLATKQPQ